MMHWRGRSNALDSLQGHLFAEQTEVKHGCVGEELERSCTQPSDAAQSLVDTHDQSSRYRHAESG